MLAYKNYIAYVEMDGEVINTRDIITFQGSNVKELKKL